MNKIIRYANSILLALLFAAGGAGGCAYTPTPIQSGIVIVQTTDPAKDNPSQTSASDSAASDQAQSGEAQEGDTPSQEEKDAMQDNVYALLLGYTVANQTSNPTDKTKANLRSYAEQIGGVIADMGLSLQSFTALSELCGEEKSVQTFVDLTPAALSSFYASLASAIGFDNAGILSYRLVLLYYDISYRQVMSRYESKGYSYLLKQANEIAEEKELFLSEIGESNFLSVAQTACGICSLAALSGGESVSLSDGEILTLLQAQKITSLTLSTEGWALLFTYLGRLCDKGFWGDFLSAAKANGDEELLAANMNDVVSLIGRIQKKLTKEDVALLKEGNTQGAIEKIFTLFNEEDWAVLERLADSLPSAADYEAVAKKHFGEEYETYAQTVTIYSLEDLKENVGKDGFWKILEGFTAGISTAAAYGIFA